MPQDSTRELEPSSSWLSVQSTPPAATSVIASQSVDVTGTESSTNESSFNASSESRSRTLPITPRVSTSLNSFGTTMPAGSFSRPSLARSASSYHPSPVRRRTTQRVPTALHTPQPREWSVFGQLMENEGQLSSATPTRRISMRRAQSVGGSGASTPRGSVVDSYFGVDIQSPVVEEDPHNFPSAAASRDASDSEHDSSDSDSDSDSDESVSTGRSQPADDEPPPRWYAFWQRLSTVPVLYRNIFKCVLAYFLGSLFTFSPYLSGFISDLTSYGPGEHTPLPSGHMVATVAVYYNPAKTMGAMVEANFFCLFGVFYSAFICLSSMSMFWWLDVKPGWEWLADTLAIVWIGVGMSFLAWMKVYMGNPQFNTACSMMAIIIFVVLVKEGGIQTLLQVSFIILCGSTISNLVCYFVWPQSATTNLQSNMTKTLDSFSTILSMLTDTFLLEEPLHNHSSGKIQRAVEGHQASFTSLKKSLKEARSEWIFWGGFKSPSSDEGGRRRSMRSNGYGHQGQDTGRKGAYEDTVDSLNRLAQHLNGLRSGTRLQYELTTAGVVERKAKSSKKGKKQPESGQNGDTATLVDVGIPQSAVEDDEETALLKAAAAMFGDLVDDLGPPLKALSSTCTNSLKRLRESFVQSQMKPKHRNRRRNGAFQPQEFAELAEGIEAALLRFESTSNHALLRVYRKSDLTHLSQFSQFLDRNSLATPGDRSTNVLSMARSENAFLTHGEHEHVFLVYFFIFTLQEFAREMVLLVDAMERIYTVEQQHLTWRSWCGRVFRAFGERITSLWKPARHKTEGKKSGTLTKKLSKYLNSQRRGPRPSFPKVKPHAPDTIQTPSWRNLTLIGRIKQTLWALGKRMNERDTKYAVKAGMATAILAAPAFFDSTRPMFVEYWGDWALISFFVVISPTIGATNFLGLHRVMGTLVGATVAVGIYSLFPDNAPVLAAFGFFFAIPCFYYLVSKPAYASSARFVLLTYNLTCLYCYNVRQRDLSVTHVAYHRAIAVIAGVVWAAIVSRFWWPAEARRELGKALGEFCLNMGWLYTRLVASNSFAPEYRDEEGDERSSEDSSSLSFQRTRLNNSIEEFMAMELHLQIKLIELQGLLAQTQHEPRLKGPFPVQLYRGVLTSLQTILDKLHSMRCVTTREEWYTASISFKASVRQDFIIPVNKERHDMVGNIILFFSTLASAFRLKAPLPPYLPPAEESRQRLVDAIRRLEVVRNRDVKGSRQLLFFAYAMTMKGVTQELHVLGRILQDAFGVIGQTPEEFEALFMDSEDTRQRIDHIA